MRRLAVHGPLGSATRGGLFTVGWLLFLLIICSIPENSFAGDLPRAFESAPYCGIFCVYGASIIEGRRFPFETLLKDDYVGCSRGSSLDELRKAAIDHGLFATPLENISASFLSNCSYPVILNVKTSDDSADFDHWILFIRAQQDQAMVLDPGTPVQLIRFDELEPRFNGIGLIISNRPISKISLLKPAIWQYGLCAILIVMTLGIWRAARWKLCSTSPTSSSQRILASLIQCSGLLVLSICLGVGYNLFAMTGLMVAKGAVHSLQEVHSTSFLQKVDVRAFAKLCRDKSAVIVDARMPQDYEAGHIDSAINISVDCDSNTLQRTISDWKKEGAIVIYCQSSACPYAGILARRLEANGFTNIVLFPAGWKGWTSAH